MSDKFLAKLEEVRKLAGELNAGAAFSALMNKDFQSLADRVRSIGTQPALRPISDFAHPIGERIPLTQPSATMAGVEALVGSSNFLPVYFLEEGVLRQKSVARVVLTRPHGQLSAGDGWATGFMVSPNLFLTNHHVIDSRDFLNKIKVQFNFQYSSDLRLRATDEFFPDMDGVFFSAPELDFTLIQLLPRRDPDNASVIRPGNVWGWIPINANPEFFDGQYLNVIQHPGGREKKIAIQDNLISELFQNVVRYNTDTEPGSSGSPVFDNSWRLVALHHASGTVAGGRTINNQGIRTDVIANKLRTHFGNAEGAAVLVELGL